MAASSALSEKDLLVELGRELLGTGIGFGPDDPGRFRRYAERWIEENADEIREAICDNATVRQIFDRSLQDRFTDAATVADALATLGGRPAVTLLALILLRRGHQQVCGA